LSATRGSVSALLTYVLEALNAAPPQVQMNIDLYDRWRKSIIISGDTASRDNTIALFNAIEAHPHLKISQQNYEFKVNRDQFRVTILPEEASKK